MVRSAIYIILFSLIKGYGYTAALLDGIAGSYEMLQYQDMYRFWYNWR